MRYTFATRCNLSVLSVSYIVMEKQLNNVQWFVFAGKPVLMPQKHLKWFKKFIASLLYIVLQGFVGRRTIVDLWWAEKWKTDNDKNVWKHCSRSRYFEGRSLVFIWTHSRIDGNTRNYNATNFVWRFIEMETLRVVCAAWIDSRTERTAP